MKIDDQRIILSNGSSILAHKDNEEKDKITTSETRNNLQLILPPTP
jgi:hypothetical protein